MITEIYFRIKEGGMSIPYGEAQREGGSFNYGFKNLKRDLAELENIPEINDNDAIRDALREINSRETGYFTIGCEKSFNHHENGYWAKGYIQISFNYESLVVNPQAYFKLFFDFHRHFLNLGLREFPVRYEFELEEAAFIDRGCLGFTVAVWIQTMFMDTDEFSRNVFNKAVQIFSNYLVGLDFQNNYLAVIDDSNNPIY